MRNEWEILSRNEWEILSRNAFQTSNPNTIYAHQNQLPIGVFFKPSCSRGFYRVRVLFVVTFEILLFSDGPDSG